MLTDEEQEQDRERLKLVREEGERMLASANKIYQNSLQILAKSEELRAKILQYHQ